MRNKFYALFILFCLAAPLLAGYCWLQFEKKQVQKAVKEQLLAGMDYSDLVLLKFTPEEAQNQLHWEHSREFEYRGQMFDVVRSELKGDTIYFQCYLDRAESKLNQQLRSLVAQKLGKDPAHQDNQLKLIQLYKSLFAFEHTDWACFDLFWVQALPYPLANAPTLRALQPPPLPPPELG